MNFISSARITGPPSNQEAFDLGGASQTDIRQSGRKAEGPTFSELLNETIGKASQPTSEVSRGDVLQPAHAGAINEMAPGTFRGRIVNTGNPLDLAVDGEGFFVLTDGQRDVYTRTGSFAVDVNLNIVDPTTGFRLKRVGPEGEIEGFQTPGSNSIRVPYAMPLPPKATSEIAISGNLSANAAFSTLQRQKIASDTVYTYENGSPAEQATLISQLDQYSGVFASGTITFGGFHKDGRPFSEDISLAIDQSTTLGDIIGHLNTNVLDGATASLINGRIQVVDNTGGYSRTDMTMSYSGEGSLATPAYFEILTPGGDQSSNVEFTVYDSQGNRHALSAAFVRTNVPNTWDLVLTSVAGDIAKIAMPDRRVNAITFDAKAGSYRGIRGSDQPVFVVAFANDKANPQTIRINMGTAGRLDGLTQFPGNSTAAARSQDGYGPGVLSTAAFNRQGALVGTFSNGARKNIGAVQIATFRNSAALERTPNGYYVSSTGSGLPVVGRAMAGGTGAVHSGALEKSDSDVAADFVDMIHAQNRYRSSDILRDLTGLIG